MRFKDKVAIITGGSQGMGKAAALGFSKEGADVVITARSEEKLQKAAEEIQAVSGRKVLPVAGDVTSSAAIKNVVATAVKEYGKVDILFNYVGGEPNMNEPIKLFVEQDEEYWDKIINLNLKSTIMYCRAVLDGMMERKYGKIINTSALAGRMASPRMVLYSAVKAGIIGFSRSLALEVADYNINVNCVNPGPVATPGFATLLGGNMDIDAATKELSIVKRIGKPEDVGNAVLYLASDEAGYITGQALAVDGGRSMV